MIKQISMKTARNMADLTQAEMAEIMGVSTATISLWEKGKRNISAKDFDAFCRIVNLDRDDILLPESFT